jgi:two-component system NarL family sensor kinase
VRTRAAAVCGAAPCLLLALTGGLASVAVGWDFSKALESFVVSNAVIGLGFGLCGALLVWHRPDHPVGWLFLVGGLLQNVTAAVAPLDQLVHDHGGPVWSMRLLTTMFAWAWPVHIGVCLPLSLALLPDGRLPSPRWRPWFVLVAVTSPLFVVETGTSPQQLTGIPDGWWTLPHDGGWSALWTASELRWVLSMLFGLAALAVRYRRGNELVRRQLLWVVAAAAFVLAAVTPWSLVAGTPVVVLFAIPLLPVAITVAVLRHGLLDIRLVLARGLAYFLLSALVLAGYALLVLLLSGVASALLVALLAFPLRARLQAAVDRLLYGDRGDPVRLASRVGGALSDLSAGLEAVRETMRLPYVAIVDASGTVLGEAGLPVEATAQVVLSEASSLLVGLRAGERVLGAADARVLEMLSGPLAVAGAAPTTSRELQVSRERLVTAREEERRRLRRDLHDGLGPLLTGVALAADAAANVQHSAPDDARDLLRGVRTDTRTAIAEVRRLVDDLRPRALDELGLVPALELRAAQAIARADGAPLVVTVTAGPLGELPAALEVAVYRIVTEALNNVVRHSSASRAEVRLCRDKTSLVVEVLDDGPLSEWGGGVGTTSMRERAEELGGSCVATSTAAGGLVRAALPLVAA